MSTSFFKASDDVHDRMKALIGQNHPDLALICDEIGIVFREKAANSGGQRQLGKTYKPSPSLNAMYNGDLKFIIELPADIWENELTSTNRDAMLDHHLCSITAELDDETGEPVCQRLSPDIVGFKENIERFGMWYPKEPETTTEGPEVDGLVEGG